MKHLHLFSLLAASLFSHASDSSTLDDLSSFKWENRLVIVNEPTDLDAGLAIFETYTAEVADRDIIWFVFDKGGIQTNFMGLLSASFISNMQQQYRLEKDTVVLIGKDGGLKSREDSIDIQTLFSTIDAMPMRQREMSN